MDKYPQIAKIIFEYFTDPIIIDDLALYFYTGKEPRSCVCILDDNEKMQKEVKKFMEDFIFEEEIGMTHKLSGEINGVKLTIQLYNGRIDAKCILEKLNYRLRKKYGINICAYRGCKNTISSYSNVCNCHISPSF